jgi:hypothetical protein
VVRNWRVFIWAAFLLLLVFLSEPVRAVEGDAVSLRAVDISRFPEIRFYLSITNYLGALPEKTLASALVLKEDGNEINDFLVTEEQTGYRLAVVLFPGADFLRANSDGERRIDSVQRIASEWLSGQSGRAANDVSLLTPEGTSLLHGNDLNALARALQKEQPGLPSKRSMSEVLSDAIGTTADPLPQPGMRSAILFLSATAPGLEEQSICPRARELGLLVYGIWVGGDDPTASNALAAWAATCGGYFGSLSNEPGLHALLNGITSQQQQYLVEYRSLADSSGDHAITVDLHHGQFGAESPPFTFPLRVQPPVVTFSRLPGTLQRSGTDPLQSATEFEPTAIDIEPQIDFPDGHPRKIVGMRLFIDGKEVSECKTLPCPLLHWDLSPYADSGTHTVRLVVQDELGLTGDSQEQNVRLIVLYPSAEETFWARYAQPLGIGVSVVVFMGLFIILPAIVGRRPQKMRHPLPGLELPTVAAPHVRWIDNMNQWWQERIAHRKEPSAAPMWILMPMLETHEKILLAAADVRVGSDPKQTDVCLLDDSVSPLHTRFMQRMTGEWWAFDMGSVAGTWVNGDEIPGEGYALREGDFIQIGRSAFHIRSAGAAAEEYSSLPREEE